MTSNDLELVERYCREGCEEAFATLVHRHLDLVYSAALRQVRSPQLAEEVAQSVFTDLSMNPRRLKPDTVLTAWLYQVTRRTAIDVVRRESRRQAREQLAMELTDMNAHPSVWNQIEPLLDEAMESLDASERSAILLRFFENRSLRQVGEALGTSEDAAQKRVSRAIEHLRQFFSSHGLTVGASVLIAALSANAVTAAPIGLGTAISTGALASTAALHATTATIGTIKGLAMTTLQKILITVTVTTALGAGIYEASQISSLNNQLNGLQRHQEPLEQQVRQSQRERDVAVAAAAAFRQENEQLRSNLTELPRLRGEVARLRDDARQSNARESGQGSGNDPQLEAAFKTWAERATRLRQRFDQAGGQRIPELQFLTEKGWFDAVKGLKQLETEDDFQQAFSNARNIAKDEFGRMLRAALRKYADANNGELPQELSQLKPFFDQPVDDAALARYKLLQTGKLSNLKDAYLVGENAPLIDEEHDATYQFSMTGTHSHSGSPVEDAVKEAGIQYAQAHDGLLPTDASQLTPYLKQPLDPQKIQKVLSQVPPGVTTLEQLKAYLH
jgi:RNA polymerase sigma factor (sigma-70 family)